MTEKTKEIVEQVLNEVNRKYEALAREEGIKEGMKKGIEKGTKNTKEEIARKLKGILPVEEISKITGLSINTIMLL